MRDLKEITAADIVEQYNWTRWKAWRFLRDLEEKHGDKVVKRRGRVLYTTAEALKLVGHEWTAPTDPRVLRQLEALKAEVAEANGRLNGFFHEFSEFRRKANEWFKNAPHRKGGK